MRIILHADDLGISQRVNDAIFNLMDAGKLTSASIVANSPAFEDAVRRSHCFPHCSFGVHLNLTEFEPLRPCRGLQPLLGADGHFHRKVHSFALRQRLQDAVFAEWIAQVERVHQAGITVSHIDSHHHTHTRLALLPSLMQLCRQLAISRVRLRHTFVSNSKVVAWRIHNRIYNWRLRQSFSCTDEFGPFAGFASAHLASKLTVELMAHPGNPRYADETQALAQCVDKEFRRQYQCITYRDLN